MPKQIGFSYQISKDKRGLLSVIYRGTLSIGFALTEGCEVKRYF